MTTTNQRIAVALLTLSAAGFTAWQTSEGFADRPAIPTKGDVPTIGYGSTRYETGAAVRMTDPPITRQRGEQLARNLMSVDEQRFRDSIPGVELYQDEYDVYNDFIGQYGIGTWRAGSPRRLLLAGNYVSACQALLKYKYAAGYDCSTPGNTRCAGVWTRQLKRHAQCMAAQ